MTLIPATGGAAADDDAPIAGDGFWPSLSVRDFRSQTGAGNIFPTVRLAAEIATAAIETQASIKDWRLRQIDPLSDLSAALYRRAVYCLARARLLDVTRDYDSTKSGHARADALDPTSAAWRQAGQEALARLIGRSRSVVDLI